ncbi:MAG: hypothetical protein RLY35_2189 [Bacteroidota bacterium]
MKNYMFFWLCAIGLFAQPVLGQLVVTSVSFEDVAERYNTQSMEGDAMKWIQTFQVHLDGLRQSKTGMDMLMVTHDQSHFGKTKLYQWDPMFGAWKKAEYANFKVEYNGADPYYSFTIFKSGVYGVFSPIANRKPSILDIPEGLKVEQLSLVDQDLKVVLRYDYALAKNQIKIPIDFPTATMQINAKWLDKKGKVFEANNIALALMDPLTQKDLDEGRWMLSFDPKTLTTASLTAKK